MPIIETPFYIHEPTPLQCGQAVLSMLTGLSTEEICNILGNNRETTLKEMLYILDYCKIKYLSKRCEITSDTILPDICILSLETPKCWHWSLYRNGVFYDPEYGILEDFPNCNRKYYWKIEG